LKPGDRACDLSGVGVLVTRPERQSASLCELIAARGGRPIPFPALTILPAADPQSVAAQLKGSGPFDIAVFVSPNAVRYSLELLDGAPLPGNPRIAAVGKGTARALEAAGLSPNVLPRERFDSEALLEMDELRELKHQRVLIVRGNGGRALLGETLQQRGADVVYSEVYRREPPSVDAGPLLERWIDEVQVVTVTSVETLENLAAILGRQGKELLEATPLVVISERIGDRARALGHEKIILARRAEDEAIVEAVCEWAQGRSPT
jgi:uroporphyrinogen-III synthase